MSKRDGKDKFYRNLNLDKDEMFLVKWLRKTSKELKNNEVKDNVDDK